MRTLLQLLKCYFIPTVIYTHVTGTIIVPIYNLCGYYEVCMYLARSPISRKYKLKRRASRLGDVH